LHISLLDSLVSNADEKAFGKKDYRGEIAKATIPAAFSSVDSIKMI
jgi:hypothetical protein